MPTAMKSKAAVVGVGYERLVYMVFLAQPAFFPRQIAAADPDKIGASQLNR
jgi:hypothetical protein